MNNLMRKRKRKRRRKNKHLWPLSLKLWLPCSRKATMKRRRKKKTLRRSYVPTLNKGFAKRVRSVNILTTLHWKLRVIKLICTQTKEIKSLKLHRLTKKKLLMIGMTKLFKKSYKCRKRNIITKNLLK